jgi:hypothetical protein
MPVFTRIEDVAGWLAAQPRDVGVVFAARAALRVIPTLPSTLGLHGTRVNKAQGATVLRVFRCAAAAWAVASFPGRAPELRPAALAANADGETESDVERAATYAAAAAGGGFEFGGLASSSAKYAVESAARAGRAPFEHMLAAFAGDAEMLDQRISPVTLALSSTLWPGMPDWPFEEWAELERALLDANEYWEVWTDWYEARLKAGPADQVIEIARATMPNEMWKQGPNVVNAEIRRWLEEREIWHGATADLAEPSPNESGAQKAYSGNELDRTVDALSQEERAIAGVRAALRAVPLFTFGTVIDLDFAADFLLMMRTLSAAWVAAKYPARIGAHRAFPSRSPAINSRVGITSAIGRVVGTTFFPINQLRDAFIQSDGHAAGAAFDLALSQDLADLTAAPASDAVAELPLWPGDSPPEWVMRRWDTLKRDLIEVGLGWEYWVDWYENRLFGRVRSEDREFAYIEVPTEQWAGGPLLVNTWIINRIKELESTASRVDSLGERVSSASPSRLKPLAGVPSAFGFGWTAAGTIRIVSSPANWPVFPLPSSEADHRNRLDACRILVQDVISALKAQKYNARPEYADALICYHARLPNAPGTGNILLADAEARRLRDLWANDHDSISAGLASRLKILLEQHIGLRPYYPEIEKFYRDVQSGRIETPLPQDAVEGFIKGVQDHTPSVFDPSVSGAVEVSAQPAPEMAAPDHVSPADQNQPEPPADPLKELDPKKAHDFTIGGVINALWKVYLEGDKVPKAAEGWKKAGDALQPFVDPILEWLRSFVQ